MVLRDEVKNCALFRGCDAARLSLLLEKIRAYEENFSPGDEIPTREKGKARIGILLEGRARVISHGENGIPLNRLEKGGVFGVSALFGCGGADTRIVAESEGKALFFREADMEPLWEEAVIRKNILCFLTDRICFLNRKIAFFTGNGAEGKVARYLSQSADAAGICTIPSSLSDLAKSLHLGRASLYRALETLEKDGVISREKKVVRILKSESLDLFSS